MPFVPFCDVAQCLAESVLLGARPCSYSAPNRDTRLIPHRDITFRNTKVAKAISVSISVYTSCFLEAFRLCQHGVFKIPQRAISSATDITAELPSPDFQTLSSSRAENHWYTCTFMVMRAILGTVRALFDTDTRPPTINHKLFYIFFSRRSVSLVTPFKGCKSRRCNLLDQTKSSCR